MPRRPLYALGLVALTAACGTTVPVSQLSSTRQSSSLSIDGGTATTPQGQQSSAATTDVPGQVNRSAAGAGAQRPGTVPVQPGGVATQAPVVGPADTSPLLIGVMAAGDVGPANAAIGRSASTAFTYKDGVKAFVNALNASGGLAGRQVKYVSSYIDVSSTNYDSQAMAACASFTQDNHVAVVLSFDASFYSEPFSECAAKAHVPEITLLDGGAGAATLAKYPSLFSPMAPTVERRFNALVTGLTGNGFLSKSHKVGLVVEDCPQNQSAASTVVEPRLAKLGISVTRRDVGCVHGFGDAAAFIASVQGTVLPLRSAGVDRVVFVSGFEQVAAQYFEKQAASQGWAPSYGVTSSAGVGYNDVQLDDAALARFQGVGWHPSKDINVLPAPNAALSRCTTLFRSYAPALQRANYNASHPVCEAFFFLEAGLKRSLGHADAQTLVGALRGLGSSFLSPTALGGATVFTARRSDGPQLFAPFAFVPGCSCFRYTKAPAALG
jgi:ABC-type branched-subunit amino acid transport system substrate-binding protein